MVNKIISGGQTGVDIAGLRAAKTLGIETGGFMPKGFLTEDKDCPSHPEYAEIYGMVELPTASYPARTRANVRAADGTLFIGIDSPGYYATMKAIVEVRKDVNCDYPFKRLWPKDVPGDVLQQGVRIQVILTDTWHWIKEQNIQTLNIAGNRTVALEEPVEKWLSLLFEFTQKERGLKW